MFNSSQRRDYQSHRPSGQDHAGSTGSMSTLISAVGNRYIGLESPSEDTAWLVDRLTGRMYKCRAPDPGRANCRAEIATGSIPDKPKP